MLKEDYLMKLIRRAATAIARALDLVSAQDDAEQASDQLDEAMRLLLKMPRDVAAQLDSPTLVNMMAGAEPTRMLARAFYVDGEIRRRRTDADGARNSFRRAMELYLAVGVGDASEDAAAARTVLERLRGEPKGNE